MIISKGDIVFRRLKEEDIELVRKWRNSSDISRTMIYKEHITREMQKNWYKSIDNKFNLYFIIEYKGGKVGLINGKNIDWEKKLMETGVFFWDRRVLKSHIPTKCLLIFAELGVKIFDITAFAKIRKDNINARRFNKFLGFEVYKDIDPEYQLYKMNKESYLKRSKIIRKAFFIISSGTEYIGFLLEKGDYDCGIAQLIEKNIPNSIFSKSKKTDEGNLFYF